MTLVVQQEVSVCWFHVNLCLNVCRFVQFENCVLRNGSMPLFSVSMVNLTEEWQWFRVSIKEVISMTVNVPSTCLLAL